MAITGTFDTQNEQQRITESQRLLDHFGFIVLSHRSKSPPIGTVINMMDTNSPHGGNAAVIGSATREEFDAQIMFLDNNPDSVPHFGFYFKVKAE